MIKAVLAQVFFPALALAASGGEIRVSFSADHLVLGGQGGVDLQVVLPAGAELSRLSVNVGAVEAARRIGPERYIARFTPPDQFFPQVAIVIASGQRRGQPIVGWATLPLWGRGDAVVRTKPHAEVDVQIGDRSYGPVVANKSGVALVPVVVPPGTRAGLSGGRPVDLNVPPMSHLGAVATPFRFAGDRSRRVRVWLIVVDDVGAPGKAVPALDAFGNAVRPRGKGSGLWTAEVEVPPGRPARLEVSARLPGEPASVARLQLERTVGPPVRLEVASKGAGGRDPVPLHARLADALGAAVDGKVSARASAGSVEPFVRNAPGDYAALWRPPAGDDAGRARIRVSVEGGPSHELEVTFGGSGARRARRLRPVWFWTSAAATGAVLVTALATRGVALAQSDEYKLPTTPIERRRELKDSGEALTTASSVLFGVSAAAAVTTAVLGYFTFRSRGSGDEQTPAVSVAPLPGGGNLGVRGRF